MKRHTVNLAAIFLVGMLLGFGAVSCVTRTDDQEKPTPPIQTIITHFYGDSLLGNDEVDYWTRETMDRHGLYLESEARYDEKNVYRFEFDEKGNIIKSNWYDEDGKLRMERAYRYDECGRVIEITTTASNDIGTPPEGKSLIEYTPSGNICKEIHSYLDGNQTSTIVWAYDQKDRRIEKTSYFEGVLAGRICYGYDDKDNKTEIVNYDVDGVQTGRTISKYDDDGNVIESTRFDSDGALTWNASYRYDAQGNKIEATEYDNFGGVSYWAHMTVQYEAYDEYGNWTRMRVVGSSRSETNDTGDIEEDTIEGVQDRTLTYYSNTIDCKDDASATSTLQTCEPPQPSPTPEPKKVARIIYQVDLTNQMNPEEIMDTVIGVLKKRASSYGTRDPLVERIDDSHIKITLFDVENIEEKAALIGESAIIQFKEFVANDNGDFDLLPDDNGALQLTQVAAGAGDYIAIPATGELNGEQEPLTSIYFTGDVQLSTVFGNQPQINLDFTDEGSELFWQITSRLSSYPEGSVERKLGIFIGDKFHSAPNVMLPIRGSATITGLTVETAKAVKTLLNSGQMPVPLEIINIETEALK